MNIIECLDGDNDHKSLHSKADIEFQDYVDNEFDVSIEEIGQKINTSDILSIKQKQILKRLIIKYKPVFLKKPGLINNYTHVLPMKDNTPFFSKPYPVPIHYRDKVEKEINKVLKLGIIRPSHSNYISPMLVVPKKNGDIRLCLEGRKLNEKLMDDYESPPTVDEILLRCTKKPFMSSLNLTSSYWQIGLSEENKKYTAFMILNRVLEFNVSDFGIKTSSAALIRAFGGVTADLQDFLLTFVDDVHARSDTFEEHFKHLELLFKRALKHNNTFNFDKSTFCHEHVEFLGYILTPDGIIPDPEKITSIKCFREPINLKELQSFLGFVNFYSRFVNNYAELTIPLLELTRKDFKFKWQKHHPVRMISDGFQ